MMIIINDDSSSWDIVSTHVQVYHSHQDNDDDGAVGDDYDDDDDDDDACGH